MSKISLLDAAVSDQIAAGEVVERPSSVVKELTENSLDAGAQSVRVDVEGAGRGLIRVSDDGEGMDEADLLLSVKRHATSKIKTAEDLQKLASFGFRGEALPSIASVSGFRISSRLRGAAEGRSLDVEGGAVGTAAPAGRAEGTTVEVRRLFYNTPARLKFLKADATEMGRIQSDLSQMALACPQCAFRLTVDGRQTLDLPPGTPPQRLRLLWGASLADAALAVDHREGGFRVHGWVAPPQLSRGNRNGQWLYVNGRVVEHRLYGYHLTQAFSSLLPHGRHAMAALFLELPPELVDVNVHPAKREVRFRSESAVLDCLRHGVTAALRKADLFTGVVLPENAGTSAARSQGQRYGSYAPAWPAAALSAPAAGEDGLSGTLLVREATSARPSHTEASPWGTSPSAPVKADWPVPLAQLHRSYLLCQDVQGLVVVDQHAAHERVLYERQLKAWAGRAVRSQRLLLPQRLNVNEAQARHLREWMPVLAELGLELEDVGGGLFFASSLPEYMKHVQAAALLCDLLDQDEGGSQPKSGDAAEDLRREAAAQLACRAAIKAGESLTWEAMQQLMADLSACEIPWSCPHGRPPLVRLSLFELEKYFLRR